MAKEKFTRGWAYYVDEKDKMLNTDFGSYSKIEPRTRKADYSEALSFEVYDPLWLLARQWQFGRFQGNDCGTPVQTKIKVGHNPIAGIIDKDGTKRPFNKDVPSPLEYDVERRPRTIDPYVRIESALHFLEMKSLPRNKEDLLAFLIKKFPLDPVIPGKAKTVEDVKVQSNTKLDKLYRFYGKRCFDGYKLFLADKIHYSSNQANLNVAIKEYKEWFRKKYLPNEAEDPFWNEKKLGYELKMSTKNANYYAEDYHSGRLSWYSFDYEETRSPKTSDKDTQTALPTPATFAAAPNRRLWEFENRRVQFNDWRNDDTTALASSVILQYTMMYSNDWMIVPLETEVGSVIHVESIEITDAFGKTSKIENIYQNRDNREIQLNQMEERCSFINKWSMFTNAYANAYESGNFGTDNCLLMPPTLQRVEQGAPVEVVQFLRDEMANMVWGVEERVGDLCGGSLDSRTRSDKVLAIVDDERRVDDSDVIRPKDADYSYLVQNRVPLHWIPFIPVSIPGKDTKETPVTVAPTATAGPLDKTQESQVGGRDVVFRRARMPIWYNGDYQPVLPSSQLLAVKKDDKGKTIPRYVYEEEIQGYGTKVGLYPQRTRWFNGTSFTWQGFEKKISGIQANSGLMFDTLLDVEKTEDAGAAE